MSRNTNPWYTVFFRANHPILDSRESLLYWASNFGSSAIDVQGWAFYPVHQIKIRRVEPRRRR